MDAHIIDDFFDAETKNRQAADETVKPQQLLSPGDFFLRRAHGIAIYGEVQDPRTYCLGGRNLEEMEEEELQDYEEEVAGYASPHMRFYRAAKCYSELCSYGELGDIHLSTVEKRLTAEEFEAAKKAGWR